MNGKPGGSSTIDVSVPHTLGVFIAWERVMLRLQRKDDVQSWFQVGIEVVEAHVFNRQKKLVATIDVTVLGRTETQTLTFQANDRDVRVTSDSADTWIESGIFAAEQSKLKAMLEEALR